MSWRAIEKNFLLWSEFINIPCPDHTTIRFWFLKLGLFLLRQPKEHRNDWIFIVDTIFGIGQNKCLVILGLSYEIWFDKVFNNANIFDNFQAINHHDVEVLELIVLPTFNGEVIYNIINNLAERVGQPLQIISALASPDPCGIEALILKYRSLPSRSHRNYLYL